WSGYSTGIFQEENEKENVQDRFRAHFTRELVRYARKHLSIAESFGLVFEQTLDRIPLDEDEQRDLYRELLNWAKQSAELFPAIHGSYSQRESREIASAPVTF
ncbi:MAG: hypothetical protein L0387_37270, partial [Acidobacteria bacterium]|nr:hypothetical protein [Acidobacteriota bacterium]